ncbi:MAG: outer membrane lipid asymmetry maintenance protein MlaD [Desulfobacterales bacterium]
MKKASIETSVGIFVLIGILCVGYLTVRLGKLELFGEERYQVYGRFQSVAGLKEGAGVEMAGIPIGTVSNIRLDQERQVAVVEMKIDQGIELSEDVSASVKTSGLIGDKYIQLSPGGSDMYLQDGDIITNTKPALDLEELVSRYMFGDV